ncbi:MAG: hypothetical protein AAFV07_05865 [Bacteroidota bacterium]
MKEFNRQQELFGHIRQLPLEISEAKVRQMVQAFTHLPPPSGSWFSSNIFNIMLSIVSVVAISGTVLWFMPPANQPAAPDPVVMEIPITQPVPPEEVSTPAAVPLVPETPVRPVVPGIASQETTAPKPVDTIRPLVFAPGPVSRVQPLDFEASPTDPPVYYTEPVTALSPVQPLAPVAPVEPLAPGTGVCDREFKFNGNVKMFKRLLIGKLKQDRLVKSHLGGGFQLNFDQQNLQLIRLNGKLLPNALQEKYRDFLANYGVYPCPRRIVEVAPEYIVVGDIIDGSLNGVLHGSANINDLEYNFGDDEGGSLWDKEGIEH